MRHKPINQHAGFTIIELLVVIMVIGILVALTLPNLLGLQRRARDDTRKNDLKNLQQALETYYLDYKLYPAENPGLLTLVPDQIKTIPTDPDGGNYVYNSAGGGSYILRATLENKSDPSSTNGLYTVFSINQ